MNSCNVCFHDGKRHFQKLTERTELGVLVESKLEDICLECQVEGQPFHHEFDRAQPAPPSFLAK